MKYKSAIVCVSVAIGLTGIARAESLLTAQSFPKTFDDLSFKERMEVLADGYEDFEEEYDENGRCIRGCVYPGITLAEVERLSEIATQEAQDYIEKWEASNPNEYNYSDGDTNANNSHNTAHTHNNTENLAGYGCPSGRYSQYVRRNAAIPMYPPLNPPLVVSSDFGKRTRPVAGASTNHPSIDLSVTEGNPVYATATGTVVQVQNLRKGYGSNILIKHDTGSITEYTQYSHLKRGSITVKVGDRIAAGCEIAKSGNTGTSSGPHLDYKIMGADKVRIDPVWPKNRLGRDYKFTGSTSPEHRGKKLPGRK